MADGEQQQQQGKQALPTVNYLATAQDDYVYESKPLPKRVMDDLARATQSGGMSAQFEIVSSGLTNNA